MSAPWIAAVVVLWALVLLLALVVLGFLRRAIGVLEESESRVRTAGGGGGIELGGVAPGSLVPEFSLHDRAGRTVPSSELIQQPTLLLFLSPHCVPCRKLAAELTESTVAGLPLSIVLEESADAREYEIADEVEVLFQEARTVSRLFESEVTPQGFVVDIGGFVLERVIPNSRADLEQVALRQRGGERSKGNAAALS